MRSTGFGGLILILALLMVPSTVHAQEATLSGTVTDSTGGVLPGVVVRAVHEASGNSFEAVTDGSGAFRLPVRVGAYRILAELAGFTTVTQYRARAAGRASRSVITLQMAPATLQESVTVTAEAPLIDTTQSSAERQHRSTTDAGTAGERPELDGPDDAGARAAGSTPSRRCRSVGSRERRRSR